MVKGTECKCNLMVFDGLVQIRQDATLLLEYGTKDARKVVERCGSIRMARGMEHKSSSRCPDQV